MGIWRKQRAATTALGQDIKGGLSWGSSLGPQQWSQSMKNRPEIDLARCGNGATCSCLQRWVGYGLFREMGRPTEGHLWRVQSGFCVIHMKFSYL